MADTPDDIFGPAADGPEEDWPEAPEEGDGPGELLDPAPPRTSTRRPAARSPYRVPVAWVTLSIPRSLLYCCEAWVTRHADQPLSDGRRLAEADLAQQFEAYLADLMARDLAADLDRSPADRQYDFAGWLLHDFPDALRARLAQEAAAAYAAQLDALRATYRHLLLQAARGALTEAEIITALDPWTPYGEATLHAESTR